MKMKRCEHLTDLEIKPPQKLACAECEKTGDSWVHLRTCQSCGITLCCDSSVNKHARKHHEATTHEVIISAEPGEKWAFCYPDELFIRY